MKGRGALVLWMVAAVMATGVACSAPNTPAAGSGQPGGDGKAPVNLHAKVDHSGAVDRAEAHLSEGRKDTITWEVDPPGASLEIVPTDPESWPLAVTCKEGTCVGAIRSDLAIHHQARHHYRTRVGTVEGPDPIIIIDP